MLPLSASGLGLAESRRLGFSPPGVTRCPDRLLNVLEHEGGEEDGTLDLVTVPETYLDFRLWFSERAALCTVWNADERAT